MAVMQIVHVVNRTTVPLDVMDDGVPFVIRPGYKRLASGEIVGAAPDGSVLLEPLPYFAAERAKRQNPIMGTGDPYDGRSFLSLVAVPAWGDEFGHVEQSGAIELLDRSKLPEDRQLGQPNVTVRKVGGGHQFRPPGTPKRDAAGKYLGPRNVRNSDLIGVGPGSGDNPISTMGGPGEG